MKSIEKALSDIRFKQKEEQIHHHTYDEELLQYECMKNGDLENAIPLSIKLFRSDRPSFRQPGLSLPLPFCSLYDLIMSVLPGGRHAGRRCV